MEFIASLQNTPLPTILVIGGILLLVLAVASELGGKITIAPQRQKSALVLGLGLLAVGVALYFIPHGENATGNPGGMDIVPTDTPVNAPTPSAPRVVSTTPGNGATEVPANLTQIVVTFSEDVRQDSWSFVTVSEVETPEIVGDPLFTDGRTCVLPVRLVAGRTYALGINSEVHQGFVSAANGNVVVPYTLTFSTAP
ncbi:MAG: Ig-like domain-containing protein [Anaerolineales bacterium]|nr:Ig-like domain-containing protein [Anaerolineales bacterium]MCB8951984.1 Ig-like domain-containing protein [Ardenticatenales bacterium]